MVWRAHVETDDVAHLVDEQWIGGQFEGFRTVRLQAEGAPDALDAGGGNPARSRHPSRAPMSGALRHRLPGCGARRPAFGIVDRERHAGTRLVMEPSEPLRDEPGSPFAHRLR